LVAALTAGLCLWIIGWALGIKAIDGFLVVLGIMVVAFAVRLITPFLREQLGR
jgi:hypothetical protein